MKRNYNILFVVVVLVYIAGTILGLYSSNKDEILSSQNNSCEIEILESQNLIVFQIGDIVALFFNELVSFEHSLFGKESLNEYYCSVEENSEFILFESDTSPPSFLKLSFYPGIIIA